MKNKQKQAIRNRIGRLTDVERFERCHALARVAFPTNPERFELSLLADCLPGANEQRHHLRAWHDPIDKRVTERVYSRRSWINA